MTNNRKPKVLLICEESGTAFWRVQNPLELLRDYGQCDLTWLSATNLPLRDIEWVMGFDVFVFHQCWTDLCSTICSHARMNFGNQKKIVLSIDDLVNGWKIPKNIAGRASYLDRNVSLNIRRMMDLCDRIVVTQPFLMKQLMEYFEIDDSKFRVFPNLPSFNWLGRYINPQIAMAKYADLRKGSRPFRIGLISSMSHYELDENKLKNGMIEDDIKLVVDAQKLLRDRNFNNYVIVAPLDGMSGSVKSRLEKHGKVEMFQQTLIRNYPNMVNAAQLDLVVVPLLDNDFNNSKSNIKLVECAALGIPVLVSDSFAYRGFVDNEFVFKDAEELSRKIVAVSKWDGKKAFEVARDNYVRFYDEESDYYGNRLDGYWLEKNVALVSDVFLRHCGEGLQEDDIMKPMLKKII